MDLATADQIMYGPINGYTLSTSGKEKIGRGADPNLTYGEVTPETMQILLNRVVPKPGGAFYDLGTGTGKPILYTAMLSQAARLVGFEIVEDLWRGALEALSRYREHVLPHLPPANRHQSIDFVHGDFLNEEFPNADIVFLSCATCLDQDVLDCITQKLATLPSGTRVISISRPIANDAYAFRDTIPAPVGWGVATFHTYERI